MTGTDARVVRPPLPLLTSLRFFAAAIVVAYHVFAPDARDGFFHAIAASGTEAVIFFFILSGFVLTYVYSGNGKASNLRTPQPKFWRARFARVAPAYLVGLIFAVPTLLYSVFVLKSVSVPTFFLSLLLVPLFLQAWWGTTIFAWNVPAWSVSVEAFFYFLFPALEKIARLLSPMRLFAASITLVVFVDMLKAQLRPAADGAQQAWNIMYFPPLHLSFFVLGMALCRVFLFGPAVPAFWRQVLFPAGAVLALGLLGFRTHLPAWCVHDGMLSLAFGAMIFGAAFSSGVSLLASWPLMLLGEASYSLYITHYPLMFLWRSVLRHVGVLPMWLSNVLFVVFAIMVSLIVYRYVERPWRSRLLGHAPHPDAPKTS